MHSSREFWFLLFSVPLYTVLIGTELLLSNLQHKKYYRFSDTLQNVYLTLLNAGIDVLLRWLFYISVLTFCFEHRILHISNVFVYWLLLFLLEDLAFYIEHRVEHHCRLFWAVHVTHHSSEEFNLTTGFRSSVFQPVYRFLYLSPLAFLGFHPLDIVFMYSATQTYGILVHTRHIGKLPRWLESIFVTPSHHRVHHASNTIYLDKNMGMCLIIWDKLFGTFQEELEEEPVRYGLTKNVEARNNPVQIIFHEWQQIGKDIHQKIPFFTKLNYLFRPPGWSHDGSTKTAKQLRAEIKKNNN